MDKLKSQNPYSEYYTEEKVVEKYSHKFETKIDGLRHLVETKILKKYAKGNLFDCSLGTGRFIRPLSKQLKSYTGMDHSPAFISYINKNFPKIKTQKANLEHGIRQPDNKYDTVICIRTIFALQNVDKIVSEMKRITKPNGLIIFDYGLTPMEERKMGITIDSYNIKKIIQANNLKIKKIHRADGLFQIIKTYKTYRFKRYFNSRYNLLPKFFWLLLEKLSTHLHHVRKIYILQKS